ncbi:murein hydrolase activator EnvC family protein [Marivirga arenosa]|uniref:Peptidoglycan DD-metalloendopeptidase family protein n=1 Tax=Marivirga arenosa TaxID=3059076 RepID=A0AA51N4X1_9BACT|nr:MULTISPECIES: peptidoglycan DD-metalloendopeptidase family protein [unclassified Marivirga]WMN06279.1 peptidoglycan DD-metalloendopeptidase family protein [Marivirga sp. ABR2-2]WNB17388.1 peptidoglycan DD-metalloendopeptidase family protein [Marivirga sp. BKB1-2]
MKINFFHISLISLFLIFGYDSYAQKSREELEKEKKENLQKISEAEKILNQTTSKKRATIGQLNALNYKIQAQQSLTNSISNELNLLNQKLNEIGSIINSMESDLEKMKVEYAKMLYATQKSNQSLSKLAYVFASSSFYEMFMRLKYMEYYGKIRREQAAQIELIKQLLIGQKESVEEVRLEKSTLLQEQIFRNRELNKLKQQQSSLVTELNKREKQIKSEIEDRKKSVKNLEKIIADLIKKEIEKSSKGASSTKFALTPEAKELSDSFAGNRNKLFWPVSSGFISQKFGTHPHPVYKNIQIKNDGVDIQTNENQEIRAVFDGEVRNVAFIPGMNNVVMVQHGEYFTVYAKLKEVSVRKGDKVTAKQPLGIVYTDNDGTSEIQFQVWKNNQKMNPEQWLFRR